MTETYTVTVERLDDGGAHVELRRAGTGTRVGALDVRTFGDCAVLGGALTSQDPASVLEVFKGPAGA